MKANELEIWLPVEGYEEIYEVSSFGRVKSLERICVSGKGGCSVRVVPEKILAGGYKKCRGNKWQYHSVVLSKGGVAKTFETHKLVAVAFLGHKPNGYKEVVDHIDQNPRNNHVSNLRLVTTRQNTSIHKHNKTGYRGVTLDKKSGRYMARILINGKRKYLGFFNTPKEASDSYEKALREHEDNR